MSSDNAARRPRWRVAVSRDEGDRGLLSEALEQFGFDPVRCVVLEEAPPDDGVALAAAARDLDAYDWIVCSSVRGVGALAAARTAPWPVGLSAAAVGARTAAALLAVGADPAPVVADGDGAEALWARLSSDAWKGRRVLVLTVPGGRRVLGDSLRAAGAQVTEVMAYQMRPRSAERIRTDWRAGRADAAVIASPSAGSLLIDALGLGPLAALNAVVAIGATTSAALTAMSLPHHVSPRADFGEAARLLAALRDAASAPP